MRFISLASGSKGNAYVVEAGDTRVLVDAGLSGRAVERALQLAGLSPASVALLLVTHEHADHMRSAAVLSRRHGWPVAGTLGTLHSPCGVVPAIAAGTDRLEPMPAGATWQIGELSVTSFSVSHDASDPVGFAFRANGHRLAVATDTGVVTDGIRAHFADVDAAILESNHCPVMLRLGPYPPYLKTRIAGVQGHLSNQQAGDAMRELFQPRLRYLLLAHLSENNNTPRVAFDHMRGVLDGLGATTDLRVCRQNQAGNWIDLDGD